jgi:hypothetical protein
VALHFPGYLLLMSLFLFFYPHALGIWYLPMNSSTESCDHLLATCSILHNLMAVQKKKH